MTDIRTPPSLKWLLDRRARLVGELEKLQKRHPKKLAAAEEVHRKAKEHLEQTKRQIALQKKRFRMRQKLLSADLDAIDNTLKQHEIRISSELIQPIASQDAYKFLPFGELTRTIFEYLKCAGENPLSTTDLTISIASSIDREISDKEFTALKHSVAHRLDHLRHQGKIIKSNNSKRNVEGLWKLPNDSNLPTPSWKCKLLNQG